MIFKRKTSILITGAVSKIDLYSRTNLSTTLESQEAVQSGGEAGFPISLTQYPVKAQQLGV